MIDITKLDRLEERQMIAADVAAYRKIEADIEAATAEQTALRAAALADLTTRQVAEKEAHMEAGRCMENRHWEERSNVFDTYGPQLDALRAPFDEQFKAWTDDEWPSDTLTDEEQLAVVCAASGLGVFDGDDIITDENTGDVYLKAALGLPVADKQSEDETPAALDSASEAA